MSLYTFYYFVVLVILEHQLYENEKCCFVD